MMLRSTIGRNTSCSVPAIIDHMSNDHHLVYGYLFHGHHDVRRIFKDVASLRKSDRILVKVIGSLVVGNVVLWTARCRHIWESRFFHSRVMLLNTVQIYQVVLCQTKPLRIVCIPWMRFSNLQKMEGFSRTDQQKLRDLKYSTGSLWLFGQR